MIEELLTYYDDRIQETVDWLLGMKKESHKYKIDPSRGSILISFQSITKYHTLFDIAASAWIVVYFLCGALAAFELLIVISQYYQSIEPLSNCYWKLMEKYQTIEPLFSCYHAAFSVLSWIFVKCHVACPLLSVYFYCSATAMVETPLHPYCFGIALLLLSNFESNGLAVLSCLWIALLFESSFKAAFLWLYWCF